MSVFFTKCLGVVSCAALKQICYQALAGKNSRSSRHSLLYAYTLAVLSPDADKLNLSADLHFQYADLTIWLNEIADKLKAPTMAEHLKKLLAPQLNKERLTVGIAFAIIAGTYAETLLFKGMQIIRNTAFAFDQEEVKEIYQKAALCPENITVATAPLFLWMEYFYFEQTPPHKTPPLLAKKNFLIRFFKAVNSYNDLFAPQALERSLKFLI